MTTRSLVMNNLVAIGTAAVLTVYAAGYVRTRGAAIRFAEAEAAARRPPSAMAPAADAPSAAVTVAPPANAVATSGTAAHSAHAGPPVDANSPPSPTDNKAPANLVVAADSAESRTAADSTPVMPAKEASPPAPVTGVDSVAAADSAATRGPYRDGQYFGWGTSRHGDIQAGIEIKDGHIAGAWVAQCLTRYSCSWISALPGQVVARQSPETDYVSGATQSTNAFYYAVVEALSKAK